MNTPAHLVIAAAAFGRVDMPKVTGAAILGGFAPDFSLYGLSLWARVIEGESWERIFGIHYFSPAWQTLFAVDNSFFVWGLLLLAAVLGGLQMTKAFAAGGLLHIALDFPLHHDDGRAHFWPATDWVFESPVSYWDPQAYGNIVGPLEALLVIGLCIWMMTFYRSFFARAVLALAIITQIAPAILFYVMLG